MFEERLLLGIGVELPDARWIAVHEHRKARTEGFFAGCQKLASLLGLVLTLALTTTAFAFDGHKTLRSLGVVRGITVRSRSIFGTIGGSLQTLVGYGTAVVVAPGQ